MAEIKFMYKKESHTYPCERNNLIKDIFELYSKRIKIELDNKLSEKDQAKILKLEQSVKNLLTLSLSKGDVYIITNAGEGWVEESTKKFYPSIITFHFLFLLHIIKDIKSWNIFHFKRQYF